MTVHATWTAAGLPFEYLTALVDGRGWTGSEAIDATRWATAAQITRPVLHESGRNWGPIRAFHRALGLSSYPTFMLVDPTGTIRWLGSGEFDAQYLVDRIAQLAGVPSPPLQVYTPPPPPPPPSVRPEWRAAQGVQMDLDFGGQSGSYTLPLFTAPGRTSSQLYLEGKNGGIGISEPALYQVNCAVDTVEALEDLEILFGAGPGGSMDLTQPWTVSLSGFQWPDGQPRMLEGKVARVCAFYYTDPTKADFSFLCTTISEPATYQDGTLSVAPIPIDNLADLPPLTFAIVLEGLSLRHVNPVLSAPGGSAGTLALEPPVPNPAMGPMRLRWTMAAEGEAHLDVLDVSGRVVRVLQSGPASPGAYTTPWDLRDASGSRVAPGLYFVRYRANGETRTTRLAVSR